MLMIFIVWIGPTLQNKYHIILYMSEYKQLLDEATGPNPSSIYPKFTPEQVIDILSSQYNDRINLLSTQQNLLSKQTSIINSKEDELKELSDNLEKINDKLFTKKRIIVYDEKDDVYNQKMIQFLKISMFAMSLVNAILVYKKNK